MKKMATAIIIMLVMTSNSFIVSAYEKGKSNEINIPNEKPLWRQINEDGFGDSQNFAIRGTAIFNDYLVIGTWNFKNLILDKQLKPISFLKEALIETFLNKVSIVNKYLYSNGCEIWCYDEVSWIPIVSQDERAIMPAGFGNKNNIECSVLKEYKGSLYAFIYNEIEGGQIWRTNDLFSEWELVIDGGFGDRYNKGVMEAEIFNEDMYVGTMNFENGTEIFKTSDGINWVAVVGGDSQTKSGFRTKDNYYCHSMEKYHSYLYVGTTTNKGCEVWRTQDGENWEPMIAYRWLKSKIKGLAYPKGFGRYSLTDGLRTMIVYDDELIIGSTRLAHYKLTLGSRIFSSLVSIPLSLPPMGAQIWKYNDTADKWSRLVGGIGKKPTNNGFGDRLNMEMWSIEIFSDCVYVGTMHPNTANIVLKRNGLLNWSFTIRMLKGSAELWKYDGNTWSQVVGDEIHAMNSNNPPNGFGDDYNWGFRSSITYHGKLIVGTINFKTGLEIWEYTP